MTARRQDRITGVVPDAALLAGAGTSRRRDQDLAVHDLIEDNRFALSNGAAGPYRLHLSFAQGRLLMDVRDEKDAPLLAIGLSLTPLRRSLKDYQQICTSYEDAIRSGTPSQIETVDMARRALHNEAGHILLERLEGKVSTDHETARRLFTLVNALVWQA
ncbi:MAG: UPF0262 family protein [Hyphomicrobiales bacterium]